MDNCHIEMIFLLFCLILSSVRELYHKELRTDSVISKRHDKFWKQMAISIDAPCRQTQNVALLNLVFYDISILLEVIIITNWRSENRPPHLTGGAWEPERIHLFFRIVLRTLRANAETSSTCKYLHCNVMIIKSYKQIWMMRFRTL